MSLRLISEPFEDKANHDTAMRRFPTLRDKATVLQTCTTEPKKLGEKREVDIQCCYISLQDNHNGAAYDYECASAVCR